MRQINRYLERAVMAEDEGAKRAQMALEKQRLEQKQAQWDASWDTLRGRVPGIAGPRGATRLRPGEKVLVPER